MATKKSPRKKWFYVSFSGRFCHFGSAFLLADSAGAAELRNVWREQLGPDAMTIPKDVGVMVQELPQREFYSRVPPASRKRLLTEAEGRELGGEGIHVSLVERPTPGEQRRKRTGAPK